MNHQFPSAAELGRSSSSQSQLQRMQEAQRIQQVLNQRNQGLQQQTHPSQNQNQQSYRQNQNQQQPRQQQLPQQFQNFSARTSFTGRQQQQQQQQQQQPNSQGRQYQQQQQQQPSQHQFQRNQPPSQHQLQEQRRLRTPSPSPQQQQQSSFAARQQQQPQPPYHQPQQQHHGHHHQQVQEQPQEQHPSQRRLQGQRPLPPSQLRVGEPNTLPAAVDVAAASPNNDPAAIRGGSSSVKSTESVSDISNNLLEESDVVGSRKKVQKEEDDDEDDDVELSWKFHCIFGMILLACIGLTIGLAIATVNQYSFVESSSPSSSMKFEQDAAQFEQVVQANIDNLLDRFTAWSDRISDFVTTDIMMTWPYVTIPQFEAQADIIQNQTSVKQISFHPLVYRGQKQEWERYVEQNYGNWMRESYRYRDVTTIPKIDTDFINQGLYVWEEATSPIELPGEDYDGDSFYLPYWQVAPLIDYESLIQFDGLVFDFVRPVMEELLTAQRPRPVISNAINVQPTLVGDGPESILAVPIFEKNSDDVVGVFLITVPWNIFFENLLPAESIQFMTKKMDCGGDDELMPSTTYQIDKDGQITYVGTDAADNVSNGEEGFVMEGIPLKFDTSFAWVDTCQPEIVLYPTSEYQQEFMVKASSESSQNGSAVFVIVLGIILTLVICGVYYVMWRQRMDIKKAKNKKKEQRTSSRNSGTGSTNDDVEQPLPQSHQHGGDASPRNADRSPLSSIPSQQEPTQDPFTRPDISERRSISFCSSTMAVDSAHGPIGGGSAHNSRPPRPRQTLSLQPGILEDRFVPVNNTNECLGEFDEPLNDDDDDSFGEINPQRPSSMNNFRSPQQHPSQHSQSLYPSKPQSMSALMANNNRNITHQRKQQQQPSRLDTCAPSPRTRVDNNVNHGGMQPGAVRVNGAGMLISTGNSSSQNSPTDINQIGNLSTSSLSLLDIQSSNHNPIVRSSSNDSLRSNGPMLTGINENSYQINENSCLFRSENPKRSSAPMRSGSRSPTPGSIRSSSPTVVRSGSAPLSQTTDLAAIVAQREQQLRDKVDASNRSNSYSSSPSSADVAALVAQRERQLKDKAAANKSKPNSSPPSGNLAAIIAQREQQLKDKADANSSSSPPSMGGGVTNGGNNEPRSHLASEREQQLRSKAAMAGGASSVVIPTPRRNRSLKRQQRVQEQLQLQDNPNYSTSLVNGADTSRDYVPEVFDKPIADTFTNCTIMFADLVGFTSWSSVREPTKIFNLLESLFNAFDKLAKRRGVFKVVTIGDCYVAATGVPKAKKDHAVAMVRFAKECMIAMKKIFAKIQSTTGEDTSQLSMRFGISSGPVTGGIVRGTKSQFQLFGDTINAASKVESTGQRDKIHVSETTALHLIEGGRESWLEPREDQLYIDGKSAEQTYWINFGTNRLGLSAGHLSFSVGDLDELDFSDDDDDDDLEDFEYDNTDIDNELIEQLMKDVGSSALKGEPLASKYPNCTIFFGEVDGFTQWSAQKEPYQVFMLLEALFKAFDKIAKRREIFKIETIADCYVASAGAPYRRDDHAVAMAVFAHECMLASGHVISELAATLGAGSDQLGMRFGLHSGSVMAGVLRGEKCRFQFFGDTMNTASRMESTGVKGKIQVSEATADFMREGGKGKWLIPREEKVKVKGKGMMATFWLEAKVRVSGRSAHDYSTSYGDINWNSSDDDSSDESIENNSLNVIQSREEEKMYGLIDATVDILERLLKKIIAKRGNDAPTGPEPKFIPFDEGSVIDEMTDIIELPSEAMQFKISPAMARVEESVMKELRDYVSVISFMYSDVPYHSYEHASFIVEQTNRILSRTVTPQNMEFIGMTEEDKIAAKNMKEYSNKIQQDPLTQFSMVFAALIHGLNHPGVPDEDICARCTDLAIMYNNRCIVEQNALDTAWDIFLEPQFSKLRACIYRTDDELKIFRQLLVNCVVGSNLFDSELKFGRNRRWKKAFVSLDGSNASFDFSVSSLEAGDDMNLKATIAIEHIMQGAIWTHTMQRFELFVKWNERLFHEHVDAFEKGDSNRDPRANWYYLQLRFFDSYVIPLASRLVETELFGYNGEEYLRNVKRNRQEWELKGRDLVESFMSSYGNGNG